MMLVGKFLGKVIEHKFFIFILILGSVLIFYNLDNRCLNGDQASEAVLAKNVLSYGFPNLWDGKNIMAYAHGNEFERRGENIYVLTRQPWLMYYVIAGSYLLFGVSPFSSLLPAALFSLFTIFLSYFLAIKISNNKKIAIITTLLLTLSVNFLLFARAGRYFGLVFLFTLLMLYFYLNFLENRKRSMIGFGISSILLFHSNYIPFIGVMSGIITHFFLFEFRKERLKSILLSLLGIFLFTAPWLLLFHPSSDVLRTGLSINTSIKDILFLYAHLLLKINNHIFPFLLLVLIPFIIIKKEENKLAVDSRYILLLLVIMCSTISTLFLYSDLRNMLGIIPLFYLLSASIYKFIELKNKIIAYVFLILLLFTNIINVAPTILFRACFSSNNLIRMMSFIAPEGKLKEAEKDIEGYAQIKFSIFDFLYASTHDYDNAIEGIVKYLLKHGKKSDTVMLRGPEGKEGNIIFYTGMKVIYYIEKDTVFPPTDDFLELNQLPTGGIDWYIPILRADGYMPEGKYEKIVIDYPQTAFDNHPGLPGYQFKTLKDAPRVVIYHKVKD